jgi:hypothetical protein
MNASLTAPLKVLSNAVGVIGKSLELVPPATYILAAASSTSPLIPSLPEPPSSVEKISAFPAALSFVTKASPEPVRGFRPC